MEFYTHNLKEKYLNLFTIIKNDKHKNAYIICILF